MSALLKHQQILVDMARLRRLSEDLCAHYDLAISILPTEDGCASRQIRRNFSAIMLKRFYAILVRIFSYDESEKDNIANLTNVLAATNDQCLLAFLTLPQTVAWTYEALTALEKKSKGPLRATSRYIGNFLLDLCGTSPCKLPNSTFFAVSFNGVINLPLSKKILHFRKCDNAIIQFKLIAGEFFIVSGHEILPLACVADIKSARQLSDSGIIFSSLDPMLSEFYPSDEYNRAASLYLNQPDFNEENACNVLSASLKLVDTFWPDAYMEICETVRFVVPVSGPDNPRPNNHSVHKFRGLIGTTPRPSYLGSQMWLHESGHNQFSSLLDLYPFFEPTLSPVVLYSPFTNCERPIQSVLHGIYSFARDLEITRLMLGRLPEVPGYSMLRYFERNYQRWIFALEQVEKNVIKTKYGMELISGFHEINETLRAV